MKQILLFIVLLPLYSLSQQDSTKPNTKLETISIKVGTIIKKKYDDLYEYRAKAFSTYFGGNGNLIMKALSIKDVATGLTLKGLYFYTVTSGTYSRDYTGYIDATEISGLIKFLDFLDANKDNVEDEGTEYIYSCNDVQFSAFNTKVKNTVVWRYIVKVDRYYSGSTVYLDIKDLNEINQKLKDNKSKFE